MLLLPHNFGQFWLSLACFSGFMFKSFVMGSSEGDGAEQQVHLPWFHDAYNYWDFDTIANDSVLELKQKKYSLISGEYDIVFGPKERALELKAERSYVRLGDYAKTCLPNPGKCNTGFTMTFWVHLGKVVRDGVMLQLGFSRGRRGITISGGKDANDISLSFNVNSEANVHLVKATLTTNVWHHIAIVWENIGAAHQLSVFVNCSLVEKEQLKNPKSKKATGKVLYLGANHSKKKFLRIAVDEFAIWLKSLGKERLCQVVHEKKVHGNYTSWSEFSPCSTSCGPGTKSRLRNCTNPSPDYGGRNCTSLGAAFETQPCNIVVPCPIVGGYTKWSTFSSCSLSCGGGKRVRNRSCTKPTPMYGGKNCSHIGKSFDVQDCNTNPCPIHGNYSSWSNFGPCSVSCGGGVQERNRSCSNPVPQLDGKDCSGLGPSYQVRRCNLGGCPVNGGYTEWSAFTVCSKTCGNATKTRTRGCTNPKPRNGGKNCTGPSLNTISCDNQPCPIHGNYSQWSVFSPCDKTCGKGTKTRRRNCSDPEPRFGGRKCSNFGPATETVLCNVFPCPVHGNFSAWSSFSECSGTCGNNSKRRTRNCTNPTPKHGGKDCSSLGPEVHVVPCSVKPCPIHGNFSEWSSFSECSNTCGNSSRRRTRNCTNPIPMHGGNDCSSLGHHVHVVPCHVKPCPVHGNFSEWSTFSECSSTCGNSTRKRTRSCTNPNPMHGGNDCSLLGPDFHVVPCDVKPCPVHGNFSQWSNFSECSSTCGNSTRKRTRSCTKPTPMHGGNDCLLLGPDVQFVPCELKPCPVHGNFSDWSSFSECSSTCGNSTRSRTRSCTNPTPMHGGNNCSLLGADIHIVPCELSLCPVHGNFSEWSSFSECSRTCGNSSKRRTRNCTNPAPVHGGNDCSSLGPHFEEVTCDVSPCPVHGNFSEWSLFTTCSVGCGKGWQSRNRTCTNPSPRFGGHNCTTFGPDTEVRQCFLRYCPINGNYSKWSQFTECTKSCGAGNKTRYRFCTNPEPQHGGRNCSDLGVSVETIFCNVEPCPIHGNYGPWSQFGICSKSCENGTQVRRRSCDNPVPRYGGRDCRGLGDPVETRLCEPQECPDIDLMITFKLNDEEWREDLTNKSSRMFAILRQKLITGILELHEKNSIRQVKLLEFSEGSVIASLEVIYFSRNFPGASVLHDALNSAKRIGSFDVTSLNFSSTDVPVIFPHDLTAFNHSSTSLALQWSQIGVSKSGIFPLRYQVSYKQLSSPQRNIPERIYHDIFGETSRGMLTNLKKYSWYWIRISGMNNRGAGVPSPAIVVLTDEDVPNSSPNLMPFGFNTSSTSLNVSWLHIDQHDVNGILRGYCIFYKPMGDNIFYNQTTSPRSVTSTLTRLEKYTRYLIQIAGVTSKGVGEKSEGTILYTDEDRPDSAPEFYSCHNASSTSILLQWREIPQNERNGIIINYRVYYRKTNSIEQKWKVENISGDQTFYIVNNLLWFTNYSFRISAFTSKGEGTIGENITVITDEDVPCAAPPEVSAVNTSSTSLWLEWRHLSYKCTRGVLTGYIVFYKQQTEMTFQTRTVAPTKTELNITGLKKFVVYNVSLAGLTSKGRGPLLDFITVSTAEDVPSESPNSLHAFNTSSTSIKLTWEPIPSDRIHGILLGYHILARKANETEFKRKYTASKEEVSFEISGLLKYTKYVVKMVGFTSTGVGEESQGVLVSTDQDVPSRIPEKLKAKSKWSPTSIPMSWRPVSDKFYIHGILLGYKIEIQLLALAREPLPFVANTTRYIVGPKTTTYQLNHLEIYGTYKIKLWAFTSIGDGPVSAVSAETCNCRSSLQSNWWINPPYIYLNSSNISGIIPLVVPDIVESCCGYCDAHGSTSTLFENETSPPVSFLKAGVSAFRDHIDDTIDLHFPMYGQIYQEKYAKRHAFIPLVESPGVVFLVLDDEKGLASTMLLETLWSTLPIFILMLTLVVLFSILVWLADNISNPSQFPPGSILAGVYEGVWWSFISMTTIGYGDRCPRSVLGRLVGIVWILIGAILVAFYTSIITWEITTEIVSTDVRLYGTQVAVIHESAEHRLAVRKNAKLDLNRPSHNLYDVYKTLLERRTTGALIDAYVLGSRRDLFDNVGVRINKIYDYSSAYGVVLAGEAKKLTKCFRKYVKENRKIIFKIIEENVDMIEEDEVTQSVKRATSLIDPSSPVYKKCLTVSVILLFIAVMLGCLFEFLQKPLKRCPFRLLKYSACDLSKLNKARKDAYEHLQIELREAVLKLTTTLHNLKDKHHKELKQWVLVKKEYQRERRESMERTIANGPFRKYYNYDYRPPASLELKKLIVRTNSRTKVYEYDLENCETVV